MDPVVTGVFTSPYPFGIDPVRTSHYLAHCCFVTAPILILSGVVSWSDLGAVQQQTNFPELVQDEDVGHHRYHSHDFWSLLVFL